MKGGLDLLVGTMGRLVAHVNHAPRITRAAAPLPSCRTLAFVPQSPSLRTARAGCCQVSPRGMEPSLYVEGVRLLVVDEASSLYQVHLPRSP